jgi:hypothetical protein
LAIQNPVFAEKKQAAFFIPNAESNKLKKQKRFSQLRLKFNPTYNRRLLSLNW